MSFDWIHRRTFHHSAFSDIRALVEEKRAAGLTISLCIPTLNEEATIGNIVRVLKNELLDRETLLDEIAVIDSGSTDRTRDIAAEAGASVHLASEILPNYGRHRGKGENLWKAVYQLKGDILCYVDGDIENIHPRFVYGLVGPLIRQPEIGYVKAFYERPLSIAQERPTGGGRVTEILVRPLFSTFYPELSQVLQPLAGEYAVRRHILEAISFPTGYSVETSHLLDVYRRYGMEVFAQTDLDERVHRNRTTEELGEMSFDILQCFMRRLEGHGKAGDFGALPAIHRTWKASDGDHVEALYELTESERPPMNSLPEYRERFATR